jgi:hypothetical protein
MLHFLSFFILSIGILILPLKANGLWIKNENLHELNPLFLANTDESIHVGAYMPSTKSPDLFLLNLYNANFSFQFRNWKHQQHWMTSFLSPTGPIKMMLGMSHSNPQRILAFQDSQWLIHTGLRIDQWSFFRPYVNLFWEKENFQGVEWGVYTKRNSPFSILTGISCQHQEKINPSFYDCFTRFSWFSNSQFLSLNYELSANRNHKDFNHSLSAQFQFTHWNWGFRKFNREHLGLFASWQKKTKTTEKEVFWDMSQSIRIGGNHSLWAPKSPTLIETIVFLNQLENDPKIKTIHIQVPSQISRSFSAELYSALERIKLKHKKLHLYFDQINEHNALFLALGEQNHLQKGVLFDGLAVK